MTGTKAAAGFNHNDFYHRFLLRQVPPGCDRALDVGCGTGLFARRLAQRARSVDAIDPAPEVIAQARELSGDLSNVRYTVAGLANFAVDSGRYDYISCLASIHHMPFAETITTLRDALTPGGVLAILGCFRYSTPADYVPDVVAVPANLVANTIVRAKSWTGRHTSRVGTAPVTNPVMTLPEIKGQAARLLPGATVRRRLFWRYSLVYRHTTS